MFRIRRIHDYVLPVNKTAIEQVKEMVKTQSPEWKSSLEKMPELLQNPLKYRFRSVLFVAEGWKHQLKGFALISYEPNLNFCFIDFIATKKKIIGRGVGGALYTRVREEALQLNSLGIFFECLPDDPKLTPNYKILQQNISRLRFYERFGARPIINTAYETPLKGSEEDIPYLVFDDLGKNIKLKRDLARQIVRVILERKYPKLCSKKYIDMVVNSFKDDPVLIREPRYQKNKPYVRVAASIPTDRRIALIVNEKHQIHHLRERGYVESPVRIKSILKEVEKTELFIKIPSKHFSERYIKDVHDPNFVEYLKKISLNFEPEESVYPYIFPIRNSTRPPKELAIRAGYYCIDTFTPLNRNAYFAAKGAVDCALTGARKLIEGHPLAYALVRPPGHHAEHRSFGGFCYLNSAAISAKFLTRFGKVAILDIDYHHGNGQQEIFYKSNEVLTVSIHGHPSFTYPYFSGFKDERGEGIGKDFNLNFPLPQEVDGKKYREILQVAIKRIKMFAPRFLIVAFGLDTAKGDPTGTWSLVADDFEKNGSLIGSLHFPTMCVQEGGYNNRTLGVNARRFFKGLWSAFYNISRT